MNGKHRLLVLCVAAAIPACERATAERAPGQLAAKVNGTEISLRQVRSAGAQASTQALEKVIERELLVQQALQAGLDRDVQVAESVENARRQILAQAYIDRIAAGGAVSREEVHAFYAENPALFAERRIYRLRETKLMPAERVPLAHLTRLSRLSAGDTARFEDTDVELLQAEDAPLSEQEAAPLIEQFLGGRKRLEQAAAEVKRLRAAASIEYAGDFKAR
jgi:EpsD family peptidyl-prolyl cis-trans isomerase